MTEKSESNNWETKRELYEELCKKYGINPMLDVSANASNTKCLVFISAEQDALKTEWTLVNMISFGKMWADVWCNPPLGKTLCKAFILRAFDQWKKYNLNILMIVPAGVIARGYFQPVWEASKCGKIIIDPITPRPRFLYEGKEPKWNARNDYISILFKRQ